jgi:hypothetical protein
MSTDPYADEAAGTKRKAADLGEITAGCLREASRGRRISGTLTGRGW